MIGLGNPGMYPASTDDPSEPIQIVKTIVKAKKDDFICQMEQSPRVNTQYKSTKLQVQLGEKLLEGKMIME